MRASCVNFQPSLSGLIAIVKSTQHFRAGLFSTVPAGRDFYELSFLHSKLGCNDKLLEQLAGREVADEAAVGGEKVIAGQFAQRAPAQVVENAVGQFA